MFCFSFDGIKNVTSGEGGAVVSDNLNLIRRCNDARLLGVEKDTEQRYKGKRSFAFNVSHQGFRYHMSNLMAAIGVEQLKKSERIFKTRQKIANLYDSLLKDFPGVTILKRDYKNIVPHIYVIKVEGLNDRGALQSSFLDKGIEVGYHYKPNHHLGFFSKQKLKLPITDERMTRFMITLEEGIDLVFLAFNNMIGGEIYVKKIPSMKVIDIAECILPNEEYEVVGIRPGEKIHEQMITAEDSPHTYEYGGFYKILPAINNWNSDNNRIGDGKKVKDGFVYSSDNNDEWMSQEDLKKWINYNIPKIGKL